jgi:hypothetical protein
VVSLDGIANGKPGNRRDRILTRRRDHLADLGGFGLREWDFALSGYSTQLPKVEGASPYTLRSLQISSDGFQWIDLQDAVDPGSDPGRRAGKSGVWERSVREPGPTRSIPERQWVRLESSGGAGLEEFRFESGLFLAVEPASPNPAVPNRMFTSRMARAGWNWSASLRQTPRVTSTKSCTRRPVCRRRRWRQSDLARWAVVELAIP